MNISSYIYESTEYTPPILIEVEDLLSQLKEKPSSTSITNRIEQLLEKFTKIKNIAFEVKKGFSNATIHVVHKKTFSTSIIRSIRDIFGTSYKKKIESSTKLVKLNKVEESARHIKFIQITMGLKYLKDPKRCMGIILHEIGHAFQRTSGLIDLLVTYHQMGFKGLKFTYITMLGLVLTAPLITSPLIAPLILFSLIGVDQSVMRGLGETGEFAADNYATKYGYGDELVKEFYKDKKRKKKHVENLDAFRKLIYYFDVAQKEILSPDEHPSNKRRIQNIKNRMEKEYSKIYPDIPKDITKIFNEMD